MACNCTKTKQTRYEKERYDTAKYVKELGKSIFLFRFKVGTKEDYGCSYEFSGIPSSATLIEFVPYVP